MVKKTGNLYEEFISSEHWHLAMEKALEGKKSLFSVKRFIAKGTNYIEELRQQVIDGTFKFAGYNTKTIYEPKERKLYIARLEERIYHWACMILVERIFEPVFISDSYSCRKKKGQHQCSQKCMEIVRRCKYVLQVDMSKFYPSMNQQLLKERLAWKIKDKKFLEAVYKIIDSFHPNGEYVGCPIGNYSSQIFGNIYMTPFDYFVKETLGCKNYARYCDDGLLGSDDKNQLKEWKNKIVDYVENVNKMRLSKVRILKTSNGVDFVGYVHFPDHKKLRKRTAKRIAKRIMNTPKWIKTNKITLEQALGKVASAIGWCKHANSYGFVKKIGLFELKEKILNEEIC